MAELRQEDILASLGEVRDLMTYLFNPFRPFNQGGNLGPSTPGPIPGMVGHFPTPEEVQADLDSPKYPIRDLFYKADNTENPPGYIFPQSVMGQGGEKQSFPDWLLSGTSGRAVDLGSYGALGYGGSKIPKFSKGLGEKGAFDASSINKLLKRLRDQERVVIRRTVKPSSTSKAHTPDADALVHPDYLGVQTDRGLGFSEKIPEQALLNFRTRNYELNDAIRSARTDLAEVLGKGRTSKSTAPNARARRAHNRASGRDDLNFKMQAADRLALNPRLANAALEEANLNPKQLTELERMLEILRNRGVK
jgi:hypothetical protein